MDLEVTLTVQMQAPHSDFFCPLTAAVMLCKNHSFQFCTFLPGTLCYLWASFVELLWNLIVLVTGLDTVVNQVFVSVPCPQEIQALDVLHVHVIQREQTYNLLSTDLCAGACPMKDSMHGLCSLVSLCDCICTNSCCAMSSIMGKRTLYSVVSGLFPLCPSLINNLILSSSMLPVATASRPSAHSVAAYEYQHLASVSKGCKVKAISCLSSGLSPARNPSVTFWIF